MGFCLFEHATNSGLYFAVNPEHVKGIAEHETQGRATCFLSLSVEVESFVPLAFGTKAEVEAVVMEALRIGVNKADITILTGRNHQSAQSLLLNQPGRVVLVREMDLEEFSGPNTASATAGQMFSVDGKVQLITQRPGVFAQMVNRDGKVPMIKNH